MSRDPAFWLSAGYQAESSLRSIFDESVRKAETFTACAKDTEDSTVTEPAKRPQYAAALQAKILSGSLDNLDAWKQAQAEEWLSLPALRAARSGVCQTLNQVAKDIARNFPDLCKIISGCVGDFSQLLGKMPPAKMAQEASQHSPILGDLVSVFSSLSVIARDAKRTLRNADAAVPKIELGNEFLQGDFGFVFNEMMFVPKEVAMAVRATERLHHENPLLRNGKGCSGVEDMIGVRGDVSKWEQPAANPYFAALCDPVFGRNTHFNDIVQAHLLRDGSPLKRLLSRVDADAAFLRLPPIADKKWIGSFNNHPSEDLAIWGTQRIVMESAMLHFITLGTVCDEELFLRMADFRLTALPNTGHAATLIMLESLVEELLEKWPAAAAGGGNAGTGTTIKGVLATVANSPNTATDVYDSYITKDELSKFQEVCTPLFNPRIPAWGKRIADAFSASLLELTTKIETSVREARREALAADKHGATKKANFWAEMIQKNDAKLPRD